MFGRKKKKQQPRMYSHRYEARSDYFSNYHTRTPDAALIYPSTYTHDNSPSSCNNDSSSSSSSSSSSYDSSSSCSSSDSGSSF